MTPKQMAAKRWNKPGAHAKASARAKARWDAVSTEDRKAIARKMVEARERKRRINSQEPSQ